MKDFKFCPTCSTNKHVREFGINNSRPDGLQSLCRACKRITQDRWYQKNKAHHVSNVVKRRREVESKSIKAIVAYLEDHPCVDCGESNPVILEFDHVRGRKLNSICSMINRGCTWKTIYAEIQKCEVRCCNCHRLKTAKQFGYRKMLLASTD